jgi:hypothetical protein
MGDCHHLYLQTCLPTYDILNNTYRWIELTSSVGVSTLLLTVLGFVVGLSLSFRSSTAYERYIHLLYLLQNKADKRLAIPKVAKHGVHS